VYRHLRAVYLHARLLKTLRRHDAQPPGSGKSGC
jgi:hypothetical protein